MQTIIWPRTSSPSPCGPLDVRIVARSRATSPRATLQEGEKVNLFRTCFAFEALADEVWRSARSKLVVRVDRDRELTLALGLLRV